MRAALKTMPKKRKKRMDWRCNNCHEALPNKDAVIAHYRREHREDGWGLWDICGTTGCDFADTTVNHILERARARGEELRDAKAKAAEFDKLLVRWNALCRALQIGSMAMAEYRLHYEREEK